MTPALFGEFMGTLVLVLMGNGTVANVVLKKTLGNTGLTGGLFSGVRVRLVAAKASGEKSSSTAWFAGSRRTR